MFILFYVDNNIIENDSWKITRRNWELKCLKKFMIYAMYWCEFFIRIIVMTWNI